MVVTLIVCCLVQAGKAGNGFLRIVFPFFLFSGKKPLEVPR